MSSAPSPPDRRVALYALPLAVVVLLGWWLWSSKKGPVQPVAPVKTSVPTASGAPTLIPSVAPTLKPDGDMAARIERDGRSSETDVCGGRCICSKTPSTCGVGRQCAPGACSEALPSKEWRLRLGALSLKGQPKDGPDGATAVCVRASGKKEEVCTTVSELRSSDCASGTGLRVTSEQLLGPGLDIEVRTARRGGEVIDRARGAAYKFMVQRDLCLGVRFGGAKFEGAKVEQVSFYLDEI